MFDAVFAAATRRVVVRPGEHAELVLTSTAPLRRCLLTIDDDRGSGWSHATLGLRRGASGAWHWFSSVDGSACDLWLPIGEYELSGQVVGYPRLDGRRLTVEAGPRAEAQHIEILLQ